MSNIYDGFGRLVSSTTTMDGVSRRFDSQYDAAGNRTLLSSPSDYYAAFSFDALGRMSAYKEGATTVVGFEYDNSGRRSALRFAGGTSSASYGYDVVGRLNGLGHDLAGAAADQGLGFTHNPASQIATRSSSNDSYASNAALDVGRIYRVNGLNQYVEAGEATFDHDSNGNLKSVATATQGSTSYVYDAENRLVSASGAWNATLAYDPLGRLWQVSSAAGTKRFVYDGDALVEEYDGAGNRPRIYVHGPGADEPLVWYEFTGGPIHRFYHSDHQGSIVALADDDGNALAINTYDPWGVPRAGSVPNKGRFQYTGQQWLAELGLYYYKARMYSAPLGRFLQTDPIGYDDQINLYAYVGNDPLNASDPTGTARCAGHERCGEVHTAAAEARSAAYAASADLQALAGAVKNGSALSEDQESLLGAFEKKFGSATPTLLNLVAGRIQGIGNRIGEEGSGIRVKISDAPNGVARADAPLNGNKLTIYPNFFGNDPTLSRAGTIFHEVGHSTGIGDLRMPNHSPAWMGRRDNEGVRRGYGVAATNWFGANQPLDALRNNSNYQCFVFGVLCGGPLPR